MDYIYIRAYGIYHELEDRFIRDEVQKAHDDNAPNNVIFKQDDGTWATIEDAGKDRPYIEREAGKLLHQENPQHPLQPPRKIV